MVEFKARVSLGVVRWCVWVRGLGGETPKARVSLGILCVWGGVGLCGGVVGTPKLRVGLAWVGSFKARASLVVNLRLAWGLVKD